MHTIFKNGFDAARKNFCPGILLQSFALTLVLLYYFNPATRNFLLKIPEIKQRMGLFFPALSTAFFGGLIPFLFLLIRKEIPQGRRIPHLLFMLGFWAVLGLSIDALYKGQAVLFGDQNDAATIIKKVLVDQFVFSVLWSAPFTAFAMHWKEHDFSFRAAKNAFSRKIITRNIPSILIALWGVWIPAVAIIYSLPLALQFPLFNIVLCFWSLLITTLNNGEEA
ncbi:MAG: hypothetical protein WC047_01105 [Kiritimatiellales bacterium]